MTSFQLLNVISNKEREIFNENLQCLIDDVTFAILSPFFGQLFRKILLSIIGKYLYNQIFFVMTSSLIAGTTAIICLLIIEERQPSAEIFYFAFPLSILILAQ